MSRLRSRSFSRMRIFSVKLSAASSLRVCLLMTLQVLSLETLPRLSQSKSCYNLLQFVSIDSVVLQELQAAVVILRAAGFQCERYQVPGWHDPGLDSRD